MADVGAPKNSIYFKRKDDTVFKLCQSHRKATENPIQKHRRINYALARVGLVSWDNGGRGRKRVEIPCMGASGLQCSLM